MSATVVPQVVLVECRESEERPAWAAMLSALLAGHPRGGIALVVGGRVHSITPDTPPDTRDHCPQVVFDVLSPSWRFADVRDRFAFYEERGAEEYYIVYPESPMYAEAYRREGTKLVRVAEPNGVSKLAAKLRELGVDPDAV